MCVPLSCNIAITLPCVPLSYCQYVFLCHSALVRGVGDVCSSVSHAILPSLCQYEVCLSVCVMCYEVCVPLSVMQYCHHSALA